MGGGAAGVVLCIRERDGESVSVCVFGWVGGLSS